MKSFNKLAAAILSLSILAAPLVEAKTKRIKEVNTSQDIDTLGGNQKLMEMADSIQSKSRARIVQDRIVDRNKALELGISFGGVMGGDSYLNTQSLGVGLDFHITPRWSIGARYYDYGSSLTPEGQRIFDEAKAAYQAGGRANIVDIDTPQNAMMAIVNWYPIYGKTSFMDMGVSQFDIYLLGGGGTMTLASGNSTVLTGGAGVGLWLSKHLSARLEIRYQSYQDQIVTGSRNLDTAVGTFGMGWIL